MSGDSDPPAKRRRREKKVERRDGATPILFTVMDIVERNERERERERRELRLDGVRDCP
jgi:hypothetical protein